MKKIEKIVLKSIGYGYPGLSDELLSDFSAILSDRSIHAILGRSGSGKSTFLKLLSGLLKPKYGSIEILLAENSNLQRSSATTSIQKLLLDKACLVSQFIEYESFSVEEYIQLSLSNQPEAYSRINTMLTIFDANFRLESSLLFMNMNKLSGGQRKMLALAKAMLINRPLLLLDEPTSGVDSASNYKIYHALTQIAKERFVIFSTHDQSYLNLASHARFNEITLR